MSSSTTVDIPSTLLEELKRFRLSKAAPSPGKAAAVVIKVDKVKLVMSKEDEMDEMSLEDLQEELPDNSPRFLLLSYHLSHTDGRTSFPLVLVYWAPQTSSMELLTLYTSALSNLSVKADVGKVIDFREGTLDREALEQKLGK